MVRRLALVVALAVACAPETGGQTGDGSSSSGDTTETGGAIDCTYFNACLLHPDVCPGPCPCDAQGADFFDATCVTVEAGVFLGKCVEAEHDGFSAECPFGCEQKDSGIASLPEGRCDYSKKTCDDLPCNADLPADCGTCSPSDAQDVSAGPICFGGTRELGQDLHVRWCAFGCSMFNGCCTDKWCK